MGSKSSYWMKFSGVERARAPIRFSDAPHPCETVVVKKEDFEAVKSALEHLQKWGKEQYEEVKKDRHYAHQFTPYALSRVRIENGDPSAEYTVLIPANNQNHAPFLRIADSSLAFYKNIVAANVSLGKTVLLISPVPRKGREDSRLFFQKKEQEGIKQIVLDLFGKEGLDVHLEQRAKNESPDAPGPKVFWRRLVSGIVLLR